MAGAIVPDLPVEEAGPLADVCRRADFSLIQLITPTTPRDAALRIAERTTGFIYYVSVTGITGERTELPPEIVENVAWLRGQTPLPICIGFGISRPEHVRMLAPVADGLIVGSAIVRRMAERPASRAGSADGDRAIRGRVDGGDGRVDAAYHWLSYRVCHRLCQCLPQHCTGRASGTLLQTCLAHRYHPTAFVSSGVHGWADYQRHGYLALFRVMVVLQDAIQGASMQSEHPAAAALFPRQRSMTASMTARPRSPSVRP